MFFRHLYLHTGLNRFHSTNLTDMQDAILGEDQDGPDGGTPHGAVLPINKQQQVRRLPAGREERAGAQGFAWQ